MLLRFNANEISLAWIYEHECINTTSFPCNANLVFSRYVREAVLPQFNLSLPFFFLHLVRLFVIQGDSHRTRGKIFYGVLDKAITITFCKEYIVASYLLNADMNGKINCLLTVSLTSTLMIAITVQTKLGSFVNFIWLFLMETPEEPFYANPADSVEKFIELKSFWGCTCMRSSRHPRNSTPMTIDSV